MPEPLLGRTFDALTVPLKVPILIAKLASKNTVYVVEEGKIPRPSWVILPMPGLQSLPRIGES